MLSDWDLWWSSAVLKGYQGFRVPNKNAVFPFIHISQVTETNPNHSKCPSGLWIPIIVEYNSQQMGVTHSTMVRQHFITISSTILLAAFYKQPVNAITKSEHFSIRRESSITNR